MIKFIPVGNRNEKGKALERIFGDALVSLGYTNLIYNAYRTGEEIDIQGEHRVSSQPIKCQCKAHNHEIGSRDLRLFFGDLSTERSSNPDTFGVFVSSSGYGGTAYQWYKDSVSAEDKRYFKIINEKEFFSILHDAKLVCTLDKLSKSVEMKTRLPLKDASLMLSERGVFWDVTLEDENGEIYYMLLDCFGESVKRADMDYLLSKPQLTNKNYVSLEIKEKILIKLLETDNIRINELISSLDEPKADIMATITNLSLEQIIEVSSGELKLREEIESLLGLSNYFKDINEVLIFMISNYFKSNLKNLVIPHIESKFKLKFLEEEKEAVLKILTVSPKALQYSLFGDSSQFKNSSNHMDEMDLEKGKREKMEKDLTLRFIDTLTNDLMVDINTNNNKNLLIENKIVLIKTGIELALAKRYELFVKADSGHFIALYEIDGSIEAGQYVTAKGPGAILTTADAFMAIGEYELAIKDYNSVMKQWPEEENAVIEAIHNKGLAYLRQGKYVEAINEFNKVRFNENTRPHVLINICRCYWGLGLIKPLQNTLLTISKYWPEEAQKLKIEINFNE